MTPLEFKKIWTSNGDTLSPFPSTRLHGLNLQPRTVEFLTQAGLPRDAAPYLSFVNDSEDKYEGTIRLTDQFDFLEDDFKKWIVIGSCSDGDPIAVKTESNDQIDCLDHDNYFEPGFFNSSIEALAECLVIYRDFIILIQRENGDDAYMDANFTDLQFEVLKNNLLKADKNVLADNGFWKRQLDLDLEMRAFYKKERRKTPAHNNSYMSLPAVFFYN
jgi:hypothetical protein